MISDYKYDSFCKNFIAKKVSRNIKQLLKTWTLKNS